MSRIDEGGSCNDGATHNVEDVRTFDEKTEDFGVEDDESTACSSVDSESICETQIDREGKRDSHSENLDLPGKNTGTEIHKQYSDARADGCKVASDCKAELSQAREEIAQLKQVVDDLVRDAATDRFPESLAIVTTNSPMHWDFCNRVTKASLRMVQIMDFYLIGFTQHSLIEEIYFLCDRIQHCTNYRRFISHRTTPRYFFVSLSGIETLPSEKFIFSASPSSFSHLRCDFGNETKKR